MTIIDRLILLLPLFLIGLSPMIIFCIEYYRAMTVRERDDDENST